MSSGIKAPISEDKFIKKDQVEHVRHNHNRDLNNFIYVGHKGESKIPVQKQTDVTEPFLTTWNKPEVSTPTMKATTPS